MIIIKKIFFILFVIIIAALVLGTNSVYDDTDYYENSIINITHVNASAFYDDGVLIVGVTDSSIGDTQLEFSTGQHQNTSSDVEYQNVTTNNLNSINCITFDSGGQICSGE